ncbi:MAG: protein phosphatase CheZ [Betaproteobacteria bacterium]|nr:protein phosphatase CheZ [Betaproteobacteria bacterium]
MHDVEALRRDIVGMVDELRSAIEDIGDGGMPEANVVSNARDRLRYISALTEQAAGRSLNAAEAIADRLHAQRARAEALMGRTRSPALRAFLAELREEHELSAADTSEIIQAQAFQDLVGQVVNKLMVTVQKMEDGLVHLLLDDEPDPGLLAGPAVTPRAAISQDDVDSLFD